MKDIYFIIIRLAMFAMACSFVTSCSDAADEPQSANTTFAVSISDDVRSRFVGETLTADKLVVGIFNNNENLITKKEFDISDATVDVKLTLVNSQKYKFIFWAYNSASKVYDISDLKSIKMTLPAFDAKDDAFMAIIEDYVCGVSANTVNVTLTRPLAQVNVGTSGRFKASKLTLQDVPTELCPFDNWCISNKKIEIQADNSFGTFTVEGTEYNYLSMAYVFATDKPTEARVTIEIPGESASPYSYNLPLQANHRSNLVGKFTE